VKHEDALAKTVRPHLEAGAGGRERILAHVPVARVVGQRLLGGGVLAVVKHELEQEVAVALGERRGVAAAHALEVALRRRRRREHELARRVPFEPALLAQPPRVHPRAVLGLVLVADDVAEPHL